MSGPVLSKDSVNYRPGTGDRNCGNCNMYHDHACDLVEGAINPGYLCDRWQPDGNGGGGMAAWNRLAGAR